MVEVDKQFGLGRILSIKENIFKIKGESPIGYKEGDQVAVLNSVDLMRFLLDANHQNIHNRIVMPEILYVEQEGFQTFPDCFSMEHSKEKEESMLYLDRHLYSFRPLEYIWIKYSSVNRSIKEGEFD